MEYLSIPYISRFGKNLPNAEVVSGDEMLLRVRQIKSKEEIEVIAEAYRITEESVNVL